MPHSPPPPPKKKKSYETLFSAYFVRYFVRKIQSCFTAELFYPTQHFLLIFGQNLNNLGAFASYGPAT